LLSPKASVEVIREGSPREDRATRRNELEDANRENLEVQGAPQATCQAADDGAAEVMTDSDSDGCVHKAEQPHFRMREPEERNAKPKENCNPSAQPFSHPRNVLYTPQCSPKRAVGNNPHPENDGDAVYASERVDHDPGDCHSEQQAHSHGKSYNGDRYTSWDTRLNEHCYACPASL